MDRCTGRTRGKQGRRWMQGHAQGSCNVGARRCTARLQARQGNNKTSTSQPANRPTPDQLAQPPPSCVAPVHPPARAWLFFRAPCGSASSSRSSRVASSATITDGASGSDAAPPCAGVSLRSAPVSSCPYLRQLAVQGGGCEASASAAAQLSQHVARVAWGRGLATRHD